MKLTKLELVYEFVMDSISMVLAGFVKESYPDREWTQYVDDAGMANSKEIIINCGDDTYRVKISKVRAQ